MIKQIVYEVADLWFHTLVLLAQKENYPEVIILVAKVGQEALPRSFRRASKEKRSTRFEEAKIVMQSNICMRMR